MQLQAAGLGAMSVTSALGEPLRAEIQLIASKDEMPSIRARLAYPEESSLASGSAQPIASGVSVRLGRNAQGQAVVQLTSDTGIQTPTLTIPVEITWNSGRYVREYNVQMNAPKIFPKPFPSGGLAGTQTLVPAYSSTGMPPMMAMQQAMPYAPPSAQEQGYTAQNGAPVPSGGFDGMAPGLTGEAMTIVSPQMGSGFGYDPMMGEGNGYTGYDEAQLPPESFAARHGSRGMRSGVRSGRSNGPWRVRRGDTVSAIAKRHARTGVSMEQMVLAIVRANPDAFIEGNMNLLRKGVVLKMPSGKTARSVDREEASSVWREHKQAFLDYAKTGGVVVAAKGADESSPRQVDGKIPPRVKNDEPKSEDSAASGQRDALTVSQGNKKSKEANAAGSALGVEDKTARANALAEANSRLSELEKNLDDINKFALSLKAATGTDKAGEKPATKTAPPTKASTANTHTPQPQVSEDKKPVSAPKTFAHAQELDDQESVFNENTMFLTGLALAVLMLAGFFILTTVRRRHGTHSGL